MLGRRLPRPPRSRWPSPASRLADDQARVEAVRDALGPAGRVRVDANGAWDVDDAVARDRRAGPGGRRAGVRRAAVRHGRGAGRGAPRASTCRSPPTSRSGGPPTPTGCATSRPPTSRCSRCSRSAGCAPACGSPRTSGCRSWCRRRWRPRSGIAAGRRAGRGAARAAVRLRLATVQLLTDDVVDDPLLPVDGCCRCAGPTVDAGALDALRGRRRTGWRTGRPGWPRCAAVRQDRSLVTTPRPSWPAPSSPRWSRPASARSCSPRARATRRSPFAAYDAAAAGLLRLHTRIDERTAGLPRPRADQGRLAGPRSICTSGTAVANLHPAVLEAAHAGVPLVAVTADRPARLRGTGANQTTDQVGIFGPLVPYVDLGRRTTRPSRRRPSASARPAPPQRPARRPAGARRTAGTPRRRSPRLGSAPSVRSAAPPASRRDRSPSARAPSWSPATTPARRRGCSPSEAGWPLLAEPTSGSRTGRRTRSATYRLLLGGDARPTQIERVVVFGHPTLSRPVTPAARRATTSRCSAAPTPGAWSDRPFPVDRHARRRRRRSTSADDPAWLERVARGRPRRSAAQLDALLARRGRADAVRGRRRGQPRALPPGGLLVVGASNPIRDLDLMVPRVRRRRPPQGDRQPRPVRHRRHRLDRDRRRARPAARDPEPRADGRRDVPARRQRAGPRRPTSRGPT